MNLLRYFVNTPPKQAWQFIIKQFSSTIAATNFTSDNPCIFVLSTGRVGSETLAALLSLCKNLISLHEPHPVLYRLSKAAYQHGGNIHELVWSEAFLSLRADLLQSALNMGLGYVETSPQATFLAQAIARSIPNVKFIHLARHPAHVVRSGMRRGWYAGHSGDITRITPIESSEVASRWGEMTPFQKNIWLWSETNRCIIEFVNALPRENSLFLHSEKLFAGDISTLEALFSFCSAPMPRQHKIELILGRKLNPQNNGAFPPFADWPPDAINDLRLLAGEIASTLNYSLDT